MAQMAQETISSLRQQMLAQSVKMQQDDEAFLGLQGELGRLRVEHRAVVDQLRSKGFETEALESSLERMKGEFTVLQNECSQGLEQQHKLRLENIRLTTELGRLIRERPIWNEKEAAESMSYFEEMHDSLQKVPSPFFLSFPLLCVPNPFPFFFFFLSFFYFFRKSHTSLQNTQCSNENLRIMYPGASTFES